MAAQAAKEPSRTYSFNFDTGELGGMIDGREAVRQLIRKAVSTARYRYPIYDDQYGCELEDLIGHQMPAQLLESEVARVIREAVVYDGRVSEVVNFKIRRYQDQVFVSFDALTDEGLVAEEVEL